MMNIVMFSDFALPDSCADATRVFAFAQLFRECGHRVSMVGVAYGDPPSLCGTHKGFNYEMLPSPRYYGWKAYKRILELDRHITAYLEKKQAEQPIDVLFLSNVYYDHARLFLRFAKQHGVALVLNELEWFDKHNVIFDGFRGKVNFIKNRIALRYLHVKMKNILAISSLLGDYYRARGCNTVVIPTVLDLDEYRAVTHPAGDKLTIAYAGSPARKDYLPNALRAVDRLSSEERQTIELHIYGASEASFAPFGLGADFFESHRDCVFVHGRIPYDQVKQKIASADFTVLLRPNARYANAGFPTKVGESMACGTPVIANLTSDLAKYIVDGETGIVCDDESVDSCAAAFRKALALTAEQRAHMRTACLEMATASFDYHAYAETIHSFLKG